MVLDMTMAMDIVADTNIIGLMYALEGTQGTVVTLIYFLFCCRTVLQYTAKLYHHCENVSMKELPSYRKNLLF